MITLNRIQAIGVTFIGGAKSQLKQEWVYSMAVVVGLSQGLKYTGSLKRGIIGGAATLGAIAVANGVYNVVSYWDELKKF